VQGEAVELLLEARAPLEAVLTVAKHQPNRAAIARSPSTVSFTVSLQNGFPLSSRSRRVKPHRVWCPWIELEVAQESKKKSPPPSHLEPTVTIRSGRTPSPD
jgi:hypothetical protein